MQNVATKNTYKRTNGQYFTVYNPFKNNGFKTWAENCNLNKKTILEPFAGSNNLIKMLQNMNYCNSYKSFDIDPENKDITYKDTILDFPTGFNVCITNPPYLAQNSAKRRGINFPHCQYDDLYKLALSKCLNNCENVAAIIPASFLNAKLFRTRLTHYILLNSKMFNDTQHPVCLALFSKNSQDVAVYHDEQYLGQLKDFEAKLQTFFNSSAKNNIKFNDKKGNIGLHAIDNTIEPSIRFCEGNKINSDKIKHSSRNITRIQVDTNYDNDKLIKKLNNYLKEFRKDTKDLFLTPFKGLRQDNNYRRRLSFELAKKIINVAQYE